MSKIVKLNLMHDHDGVIFPEISLIFLRNEFDVVKLLENIIKTENVEIKQTCIVFFIINIFYWIKKFK